MTLLALPVGHEAGPRPAARDPRRDEQAVERATALAIELADLVTVPVEFVATLRSHLHELGDPEYARWVGTIAPGLETTDGVRQGPKAALSRTLRRELAGLRPSYLIDVADALLRADSPDARWLAIDLLDLTVVAEPERTWQLLRRTARAAHEWITVDALAHPYGRGILAEPYRWAELEQLCYSPSRWERRLVGSTVATIPFVDRSAGRAGPVAERGLAVIAELMGDDEPDVQKALAWALRNLTLVAIDAVISTCRHEAALARETGDGHRAWVVRETLPKLPADVGAELRLTLEGVRRRAGAPPSSRASAIARDFALATDPVTIPEPPLR